MAHRQTVSFYHFISIWRFFFFFRENFIVALLRRVPDLLDILRKIDVVAQETVLKALLSYLESLCIAFGQRVARSKIQRTFELRVNAMEKRLMALASNDDDGDGDELALVAAQLTLLSRLDVARLGETFKQLVIVLSMSGASIDCLRFSVTKLCLESPVAAEHIVAALWDGTQPLYI